MINQPLSPAYGQTQKVAVTAASTLIGIDQNAKQVRFLNIGAVPVFVRCSSVSDNFAATTKDYPIGPNSSEVITKGDTFGALSLITETGTATVYVTPGEGLLSAAM